MPKWILKLESLAIFLLSLYFYQVSEGDWILFLVLFLVSDISIAGYLKGPKIGSIVYNSLHNYLLPLALILIGVFFQSETLFYIALILIAHIGFDRFIGWGLKYPTNFRDTHLKKL